MDGGHSASLLRSLAHDPDVLLILTDRSGPETLTRKLWNEWTKMGGDGVQVLDCEFEVEIKEKEVLVGEELEAYLEKEKADEPVVESDSDSDIEMDEDESGPIPVAADGESFLGQKQYDIHIERDTGPVTKAVGFFKNARSFKMFPVFEKRWRIDDYGEVIDPFVYMNGEFSGAIARQALREEVCCLLDIDSRRRLNL